MRLVWYKLKWYLNNKTVCCKNKYSNADKDNVSKEERQNFSTWTKEKSFMIFIEMTLPSDLSSNFNNFIDI